MKIKVRDFKVRVFLSVIDGLKVSEIVGASFINRFVKSILHAEQKNFPNNSRPVENIIKTKSKTKLNWKRTCVSPLQ